MVNNALKFHLFYIVIFEMSQVGGSEMNIVFIYKYGYPNYSELSVFK